tara:strand:- start:450 stop:719 length:270 start_codon:yes stop_codon:yes gene_type:complete
MNYNIIFGMIIILMMLSVMHKKTISEHFVLDDEMNTNESQNIMNNCSFSLECCPSIYSNDKGCMCIDKEVSEILSTRGYNKTKIDGFGY